MDLIDDTQPGSNTPEFSVAEIAGAVKRLIEGELGWVRVRGEVGRVVRARSGHLYFDLKDDRNVLSCMTWKGQVPGIGVLPEEGMEVVAEGRMTASGFQSKFSLNAQHIAVAGEGALMALLEKRKKALAAEGLFDEARKKPLPYLPEIIGVITSPQGAVIRDILHRLRDRFPRKVLVWPVAVQGAACAPEVARAIDGFNRLSAGGALPRPDLLIVARGGGSIEDLWGFNEEIVARAAAASQIPLISAVGHETDTTLIDFVSDKRAPTPTAAAELAVPVRLDLLAWVEGQGARLTAGAGRALEARRTRLADLARALPRAEALTGDARQRLDFMEARLPAALRSVAATGRLRLERAAGSLRPATLRRDVAERRRAVLALAARMGPGLARLVERRRDRLEAQLRGLRPQAAARDIARQAGRLAALQERFDRASTAQLAGLRQRLAALDRVRETLGYRQTLGRGYAVVRSEAGLVTGVAAAQGSDWLEIEFADGRLRTGSAAEPPAAPETSMTTPKPRAPKPNSRPPTKSRTKVDPDQGSLF